MIYFYILVPLLFIGLFLWNTLVGNKKTKKIKAYSLDPNVSKIALWIDLDEIDGDKIDCTNSYWKSVKSKIDDSSFDVIVLLLKAGEYNFTASSKSNSKYNKVKIQVEVKAGITYQLGCDDNGVYFIEDSDPKRYDL